MTSPLTRPSYSQDEEGRWKLGPEVAVLALLKPIDAMLFWATGHEFVSSRDLFLTILPTFLPLQTLGTRVLVRKGLGLGGILRLRQE